MSDARVIAVKDVDSLENPKIVYAKGSPSAVVTTTRVATVYLPGGTLHGAASTVEFVTDGFGAFSIEFRDLTGSTSYWSKDITGIGGVEEYDTLDASFIVPGDGEWYAIYATPVAASPTIRGLHFVVGGAITTWSDLTLLPGYAFSRATAATDGLPSVGLPVDDVVVYNPHELREVGAKLGYVGKPVYLLEGAKTNVILESEDIVSGTGWDDVGSPVTTGGQSDPGGGTVAARVESTSGSVARRAQGAASIATSLTASVWIKQAAAGDYQVTSGKTGYLARAVGGSAPAEWVRVVSSGSVDGTSAAPALLLSDGADESGIGGLAAGPRDAIYAFPQIELSTDFASSYIPTSGTAATRASDDLSVDLPEEWTKNTLVIEIVPAGSSMCEPIYINSDNSLVHINTTGHWRVLIGGNLYTSGNHGASVPGDVHRLEIDWSRQVARSYINGVQNDTWSITGSYDALIGTSTSVGRTTSGSRFGLVSIGTIAQQELVVLSDPSLTWDVVPGSRPKITPPVYTGPALLSWTLQRDTVDAPDAAGLSTQEAGNYTPQWDGSLSGPNDFGPSLRWKVDFLGVDGAVLDTRYTNAAQLDDATALSGVALWASQEGVTESGTVSQWDASYGGLSGSLVQATGTQQPAYSATGGAGGRPLITSDGVDDRLQGTFTKGSEWVDAELGFVGVFSSTAQFARAVSYVDTASSRVELENYAASTLGIQASNGALSSAAALTPPMSVPQHVSGEWDTSGLVTARVNGLVVDSSTGGATSPIADGETLSFFSYITGAGPASAAVQACYIAVKLTTVQRWILRALLTYLTRVAC